MRRSKQLTGNAVISMDNGTRLGVVKDVYLDAGLTQVVGLYLGSEGMFTRRKDLLIPFPVINLLGQDAILVAHAEVLTDTTQYKAVKEWIRWDRLHGRLMTTAGGTRVGRIDDVLLDEEGGVCGFMLYNLEVDGPLAKTYTIMSDALLDIGSLDLELNVPIKIDFAKAEEMSWELIPLVL